MNGPRVVLADDHTLMTAGLTKLLEPSCQIVGTATDGRALVELASEVRPDVILIDLAMPLLNGFEAARQIKKRAPTAKLIIVTMNEDTDTALHAMRIGVSGYLLKKSLASELLSAIQTVLKGNTYVTPQMERGMEDTFARHPDAEANRSLTPRQREVLQLLVEGKSMKQAAAILNVAPRTIAFHKYRIMEDFHIKSTAELVQFAIKQHVLLTESKTETALDTSARPISHKQCA